MRKTLLIVAVLLVFVFGIFGIPKGIGPSAWKTALTNNIRLGLDLKGGIHLVLQVMVDEAVSAETDNAVARIQADLQQGGFPAGSVLKPDPKQPAVIQIQGTPAAKASDVRNLLDSRYGNQYTVSTGPNNSWTLTMKQTEVQSIEQHALQQSIDTIGTRINALGVTEPTIQEYNLGTNQILVELPGVDDLSRVRDIIQSTARLEIHLVVGGPFPTEEAAVQSVGGTVPPEDVVMAYGGTEPELLGQYYVLQRLPIVAGDDFRDAQPSVDENGRPDATFILTRNAGDRFYQFTSTNIGKQLAIVLENRVQEAANIHSLPAGERGWTVARRGFHPQGSTRIDRRHVGRHDLHAGLLSRSRHQRRPGAHPEPDHFARLHGVFRRRSDFARNCRRDSDHRYGRGFERADLRAYPGRIARR